MEEPLPRFLLFSDPLAYVRRTVSDLCSFVLGQRKELDGFAVDERDVFEIDSQRTRFLLQDISERVHMLPCNPPTYGQHDKIVFLHDSVDSAAHCRFRFNLSLSFSPPCGTDSVRAI